MRIGPGLVSDQARVVADQLAEGHILLYAGSQLLASVPVKGLPSQDTGEITFSSFGPASATATGTIDAFSAVTANGSVVFEGTVGPDGDLQMDPTYDIESGDVVRILNLTYVQPQA